MATGDIKKVYAASSNLTVTNLNSLAASSTWMTGWESGAIDNTSDLYLDYKIGIKITVGGSNLQAGQIRVYLVGMLDDSTWPDVFDGTESTESLTDTEMRDAMCKLAAMTETDTGASGVYYMEVSSVAKVFDGNMPKKFVIYITHNAHTSTNAIASSGNQVTIVGSYENIAA